MNTLNCYTYVIGKLKEAGFKPNLENQTPDIYAFTPSVIEDWCRRVGLTPTRELITNTVIVTYTGSKFMNIGIVNQMGDIAYFSHKIGPTKTTIRVFTEGKQWKGFRYDGV